MNINLTFFGQTIAFLLFVLFCMKFVWPFITGAMAERQKRIADGLAAADRADRDLELAKEKSAKALREAKQEAASIVESANKRAAIIVEEAKDRARIEAERIRASAETEIDQEVNRAKEKLRAQLGELTYQGVKKILESEVDQAKHQAMVDKLAANL